MPVLEISNLCKRFNLEAGFFARYGQFVNAVNGVSFAINKNESYGLVGESGCGKTTTARLLVRMYDADEGSIKYYQEENDEQPLEVLTLRGEKLKSYRNKVRYVFQDPARSLNPRMSVYEILVSGLRWSGYSSSAGLHRSPGRTKRKEKLLEEQARYALVEVGLSPDDLKRRPAEFSGGQRQRISIARGLLVQPRLLICDEVVSALDVSIQGQILNLLLDIRDKRDISFLFIAHDLKVACYFCDRIGVMYAGELMEEAPAAELYRAALHPYTRLLFASARAADSMSPAFQSGISGTPLPPSDKIKPLPTENNSPSRCSFADRCPHVMNRCYTEKPVLKEAASGHLTRCHL